MLRRSSIWFVLLAACSGTGSTFVIIPFEADVDFAPQGSGWLATPIQERLDEVSNNGQDYTGDFDRYALQAPDAGRMQV
ncbi:MAG: hypothetical protein O7E54_00010, partial [Planctomycetota bacterium]|nr:hypothetical protein [Planctomycetota bacterium]